MTSQPSVGPRGLAEALWWAHTAVQVQLHREVLGPERLTWSQYRALRVVCARGELRTLRLVSELGVAKSSAVELAVVLERRGLISRLAPAEDLRIMLLRPTDAGLAKAARVQARVAATEHRLAANPVFMKAMVAVLERMAALPDGPGGGAG